MRLCPYIGKECTQECRFFHVKIMDCTIAYLQDDDVISRLDWEARDKLGFREVRKELSEVMTTGMIRSLDRNPNFSDEDRTLVARLVNEGRRIDKLVDFKAGRSGL